MPIDWPSRTGKWRAGEIEDDVAHVAFSRRIGQAEIALDAGHRRLGAGEQIDGRFGGGRRRHGAATDTGVCLGEQAFDLIIEGFERARCTSIARLTLSEFRLLRQFVPAELLIERIRCCNDAPIVDRAGRTRRDAVHAEIALLEINNDVVVIMRDRVDRTLLFAGITTDADFRVDQVLFMDGFAHGSVHSLRSRSYSLAALVAPSRARCIFPGVAADVRRGRSGSRIVDLHILELAGLAIDADARGGDPASVLAGLPNGLHQ